ncbi:MAG: hypothetical protein U0P81_06845 [Holophagaceae bacterium]
MFNERFWALHLEPLGRRMRRFTLFDSADGQHWNPEAYYVEEAPGEAIGDLRPLDGGWYLLVAFTFFREGDTTSKLALGRKDDQGRVRIFRLLDMGLKQSLAAKESDGVWRIRPSYRFMSALMGLIPVRSSKGLLLPLPHSGDLWILDDSGDVPKLRRTRLFPSVEEGAPNPLSKVQIENAILGIQPRPDGSFLIASRTEEAVLKARTFDKGIEPIRDPKFVPTPERNKALADSQSASVKAYPGCKWWALDPTTGTLTEEITPPGMPDAFKTADEIRAFAFRITADDRVVKD